MNRQLHIVILSVCTFVLYVTCDVTSSNDDFNDYIVIPLVEGNYWVNEHTVIQSGDTISTYIDTTTVGSKVLFDGKTGWEMIPSGVNGGYLSKIVLGERDTLFFTDISMLGIEGLLIQYIFPIDVDTTRFNVRSYDDTRGIRERKIYEVSDNRHPNKIVYEVKTTINGFDDSISRIVKDIGIIETNSMSIIESGDTVFTNIKLIEYGISE